MLLGLYILSWLLSQLVFAFLLNAEFVLEKQQTYDLQHSGKN